MIQARSPFLGAKVANLSPALADELRLDASAEGVVVVEIADGTPAQSVGFQRGDVMVSVNNDKDRQDPRPGQASPRPAARVWRITIQRGGQQISGGVRRR